MSTRRDILRPPGPGGFNPVSVPRPGKGDNARRARRMPRIMGLAPGAEVTGRRVSFVFGRARRATAVEPGARRYYLATRPPGAPRGPTVMNRLAKLFLAAGLTGLLAAVGAADGPRRESAPARARADGAVVPAPAEPDTRPLVWVVDGAGDLKGCSGAF